MWGSGAKHGGVASSCENNYDTFGSKKLEELFQYLRKY